MKSRLFVLVCALILAGASAAPSDLTAPAAAFDEPFATSPVCAMCHANSPDADAMRRPDGGGVAPFDLWGASMMAHAARDPLFHAVLSAEIAATPTRRADIETTCLRCHAPLAPGITRAQLLGGGERATLGLDGASCTVCHGMRAEGLGDEATFSGGFRIRDDGRLHGPHEAPNPMPMRMHTGYTPVHEDTVLDAALCATCHTLYTEAIAPDGTDSGKFLPEQTPYLEWLGSAYGPDGTSPMTCQACHMPTTDDAGRPIVTAIARNPGGFDFGFTERRSPFGRHHLVGGNALVPRWLDLDRDRLRPLGSSGALQGTARRAEASLANRTARVSIVDARWSGGRAAISVDVTNLTGHRFPTAHPSRRAWLGVEIVDRDGVVLYASGRHDDRGRIVDLDGKPLAPESAGGPIFGAGSDIDGPGEVAVFESVMADVEGRVTFLLTRGATYRKDSRLLPPGTAKGAATGRRMITYRPALPGDRGPFTVRARLLYQTLGARWEAELRESDTPEVRAMVSLLERRPSAPIVVATATAMFDGAVSPGPVATDRDKRRTAGHPSSRP